MRIQAKLGDELEVGGQVFIITQLKLELHQPPVLTVEPPIALVENLDKFDQNTVVTMGDEGIVNHTYSPKCPPGCYGQTDACTYRTVKD